MIYKDFQKARLEQHYYTSQQRTQSLLESEAHLRQLSVFLQRVREDDRAHFARELHDELGQSLTALRIDFLALESVLSSNDTTVIARLGAIHQMITGTIDATRRICEDLHPGMLDDFGNQLCASEQTPQRQLSTIRTDPALGLIHNPKSATEAS